MWKWLHHLFNPHCPECSLEHECKNCDLLRRLLEDERRAYRILLDKILNPQVVEDRPLTLEPEELKNLSSKHIPWSVRQAQLEADDRKVAQVLREKELELQKISTLEKEVGLDTKEQDKKDA